MSRVAPLLFILGCDPYHAWPEPGTYFPYRYTEESDLEDFARIFEDDTLYDRSM